MGDQLQHGPADPARAGRLPRRVVFAARRPSMRALAEETVRAYEAYSTMSGSSTGAGRVGSPVVEAVDLPADHPAGGGPAAALGRADALCLMAASPAELAALGDAALPILEPGARVTALCASDDGDGAGARGALLDLAARCRSARLAWHGGVAFGGGGALPRLMGSPRLGAYRRPLSQAVDRLIAAIRSGRPLGAVPAPRRWDGVADGVLSVPWRPSPLARWFFAR